MAAPDQRATVNRAVSSFMIATLRMILETEMFPASFLSHFVNLTQCTMHNLVRGRD